MRLRVGEIIVACLFISYAGSVWAQAAPMFPIGKELLTAQSLHEAITNNELWRLMDTLRGDANFRCAKSRQVLLQPKDQTTAFERLEAARTFDNCVKFAESHLRSSAATHAGDLSASLASTTVVQSLLKPAIQEALVSLLEAQNDGSFMGMTFGVGIGFSHSRKDRITDAEVAADGTLRAKTRVRQDPIQSLPRRSGW
jgi:hypothetical protein